MAHADRFSFVLSTEMLAAHACACACAVCESEYSRRAAMSGKNNKDRIALQSSAFRIPFADEIAAVAIRIIQIE